MSLLEKGSVYEQPSVYNQGGSGGGGGGGTIVIDGQTLDFPPYLVPVSYIDASEYTQNISILGAKQLTAKSTHKFRIVLSITKAKMSTNNWVFMITRAIGETGSYNFQLKLEKSTSNITARFNYFSLSFILTVTNLQWDTDKITITFDAAQKKLTFSDEHSNSVVGTASSSPSGVLGPWTFFGGFETNVYPLRGVIYYAWVKDTSTDKIDALWLPARDTDNSGKPYMVECVSGAVGMNYANGTSTSGITFGSDVSEADIQNYFT